MTTSATAQFDYFRPSSVEEASRLLSRSQGGGKLLAGGHSLVPLMKIRLAAPMALIDLGGIEELASIRQSGGTLSIGAMATYQDIIDSDAVAKAAPLLAETAAQVADLQVRNRGTIGGSLAHSDPAGDLPAAVLALKAELVARSARASRTIAVDRFFRDLLTTSLRPNEVLAEVRVPAPTGRVGSAYVKLANKASHYAVVGVAAVLQLGSDGTCTKARIGVTGAGPFARRSRRAERILEGKQLTDSVIARAAARVGAEYAGEFNSDVHASASYREAMTKVIGGRALTAARDRAG